MKGRAITRSTGELIVVIPGYINIFYRPHVSLNNKYIFSLEAINSEWDN